MTPKDIDLAHEAAKVCDFRADGSFLGIPKAALDACPDQPREEKT